MKKYYDQRSKASNKAQAYFKPTPIIDKVKAGKNGKARAALRKEIDHHLGPARIKRINEQDALGNTPLHHAVANRDELAVRMLISKGARLDIKNKEGLTPAEFAYKTNYPQLAVSLFKQHHTDYQDFAIDMILNEDNPEGIVGNLLDYLTLENRAEKYKAMAKRLSPRPVNEEFSGPAPLRQMIDDVIIITTVIDQMTRDQALSFMAKLMHYPRYAQQALPNLSQLGRLEFYDTGRSFETWSYMADALLRKVGSQGLMENTPHGDALWHHIARFERSTKPQYENIQDVLKTGEYHYLRLQGRTILLKHNFKDEIVAFKVQKHNEAVAELAKQAATVDYLTRNKEALDLKSDIPESKGVMHIEHINHWLASNPHVSKKDKADFKKLATTENPAVYVYKTNSQYFRYLHELRGDKLEKAIANNLHDLAVLAKHGIIYDQLADMFHTNLHQDIRPDSGRYLTLVNLVRKMNYRGTGRITAYIKAIEYLNMRQSGFADEGDHSLLKDVVSKAIFRQARERHGNNTAVFVLANQLAEQMLVADLGAGYANRKTVGKDFKPEVWRRTCDDIVAGVADAVAAFADADRNEIERNLRLGLLNGDAKHEYADQNRTWMTDEYIPYINKDKLPPVYPRYVEEAVEHQGLREGSYSKDKGCAIDGVNPDIGAVNGVDPRIKGAEIRTWAPVFAIAGRAAKIRYEEHMSLAQEYLSEHKFNTALKQLREANEMRPNTDEFYKKERLCLHARQIFHGGKNAVRDVADIFGLDANRKNHAATKLQRFWHEHKTQTDHDTRKRKCDDTAGMHEGPVAKRVRTRV